MRPVTRPKSGSIGITMPTSCFVSRFSCNWPSHAYTYILIHMLPNSCTQSPLSRLRNETQITNKKESSRTRSLVKACNMLSNAFIGVETGASNKSSPIDEN